MTDITLAFRWNIYRPDQREYRNQSLELLPDYDVAVSVPVTNEYLYNSEDILQALVLQELMAGDKPPSAQLTVAGLKYVVDQFDAVFLPKPATKPDEVEDDWEADLRAEPEKNTTPATDSEDWEMDLDAANKPDEVAWDENEEEWQ